MNEPTKTQRGTRKPAHQRVVPVNITLPPALYDAGLGVLAKYKFKGYSDYLAARIRKDAGLELAA